MKDFIIDTISRETLEEYGYDSSNVDDDTMKKIAETLRYSFRNCVLPCISEVCESFDIPDSKQPMYSVSRIYVSLNDENGNRHDTKLFKGEEEAIAQFKQWRDDELELRKESECAYEIKTDREDNFRLTWDDEREMLSIGICGVHHPALRRLQTHQAEHLAHFHRH